MTQPARLRRKPRWWVVALKLAFLELTVVYGTVVGKGLWLFFTNGRRDGWSIWTSLYFLGFISLFTPYFFVWLGLIVMSALSVRGVVRSLTSRGAPRLYQWMIAIFLIGLSLAVCMAAWESIA